MPPIAWAPRRWQVATSSSVNARMNGVVTVIWSRSGSTNDGSLAERLDDAEEVVPAAGVEPGDVVAQLVEDLVHLERGEDRLDEDGRPDGARGMPSASSAKSKTSFQSRASRWLSSFGR